MIGRREKASIPETVTIQESGVGVGEYLTSILHDNNNDDSDNDDRDKNNDNKCLL